MRRASPGWPPSPTRGRLTDDLVDLLIETIHHIGARAERKVERELLLADLKRVAVPLDGIVRGLWRDAVVEKDATGGVYVV